MLFKAMSFVITVSANEDVKKAGGAVKVLVKLSAGEVPDDVVAARLMSGQSARVRLQYELRDKGVPANKTVELTWVEYIGTAALAIQVEITVEDTIAKAESDPIYLAKIEEYVRKKVEADILAKQGKTEPEESDKTEGN